MADAPFPVPAASNRVCSSSAHGFPTSFTVWHAPSPCAVFGSGLFEDGREKDDGQEAAQPVLAPMGT